MAVPSELERYLEKLGRGEGPISASRLVNLTGLDAGEVEVFWGRWRAMALERRRRILAQVVEVAEDNLDLDFDALFRACLGDEDGQVRLKALEGLAGSGGRSLISPLIQMAREDPVEAVRAAAASALGEFAMLAELRRLRPSDAARVYGALAAAVQGPEGSLEVGRRALEAISPLSREEVRGFIRDAYRSPHLEMRASALYAMGRNCDPQWLPLLLREMRSPHAELRFEAARACGELEDPRALPRLVELLQDPDPEVQEAAIEALGHIGGSEAERELRLCLGHPQPRIRQAAAEALALLDFGESPLFPGM